MLTMRSFQDRPRQQLAGDGKAKGRPGELNQSLRIFEVNENVSNDEFQNYGRSKCGTGRQHSRSEVKVRANKSRAH